MSTGSTDLASVRLRPATTVRQWIARGLVLALMAMTTFYAVRARQVVAALTLETIRPVAVNEIAGASPAFLIPLEAVAIRNATTVVFAVEGDKLRALKVELGATRGNQTLVRAGLDGAEILVARAPEGLEDGDPTRIRR